MPLSVAPTSVTPGGSAPDITVHVNGPVPPATPRVCEYAVPTVPVGSAVVVICSAGAFTVIANDALADTDALSVTFTVKLLVPAALGVPVIDEPFRLNPGGSDPLAIDHVYGAVPPLAASVAEYAVPTVAAPRDDVVICSVEGLIVIESAAVADADALSVTFTVNVLVPTALGIPEIVEPVRVSPAGSDPPAIDHVYGGVPPFALNDCEYEVPTVPAGSVDVVTPSPGGFTVIESAAVADTDALSVTFTVT